MFIIKYQHDYHKQDSKLHTTIRGLSYIRTNNLKLNQIVKEEYPNKANICKILKIYPVMISGLSLEFLKADCEYEGFRITSHEDFCKLINSFIPSYYHQATPDSQKVVIELEILIFKD